MEPKSLGELIRLKRLFKKLTQKDLACQARVTQQAIAQLERTGSCRLETLGKICQCLGVTADEILSLWFPDDYVPATATGLLQKAIRVIS